MKIMKRRSFLTFLGAALTPGIPATAKPAAVTKVAAPAAATSIEEWLANEAVIINRTIAKVWEERHRQAYQQSTDVSVKSRF